MISTSSPSILTAALPFAEQNLVANFHLQAARSPLSVILPEAYGNHFPPRSGQPHRQE
ncbi:MAG: hypothetical protein R3E93_00090 [Thiothrix sp.]